MAGVDVDVTVSCWEWQIGGKCHICRTFQEEGPAEMLLGKNKKEEKEEEN